MTPDTLTPRETMEMYLSQRASEVAESTLNAHERRLTRFIRWCEDVADIDDVADVDGRDVHRWRVWRQGEGSDVDELSPETIRSELLTLRVYLRFAASIDAVSPNVAENMVLPDESKRSRNEMLDSDHATALIDHLDTYEYASAAHAILTTFWVTGVRAGTLRSFDVRDFDEEEMALRVRHRPETDSPLKNGSSAERYVAVDEYTTEVIRDYIETNRVDVEDDHGRRPLFSTRYGRRSAQAVRALSYYWTTPCRAGDCPHDRNEDECDATAWDTAAKCPSSMSTHAIRRGAITHHLRQDVPQTVVSDRMDVSADVIDRHYDQMTQDEKMEQRRGYLDNI